MFADGDDVIVGFGVLEAPATGAAGKDGGSDGASTKAASSKASTAKTGDTTPIALLAVSAMLSLAVLLASRTRVRKPVRGKHGR